MKRTLFLILALFVITGCNPGYVEFEEEYIIYEFDFTKYTELGFLITPEKYLKDYESIGLITVEYIPWTKMMFGRKDNWGMAPPKKGRVFGPFDYDGAIDSLYAIAREKGANAIMNFEVIYSDIMKWDLLTPKIIVKGFAIRRVEN